MPLVIVASAILFNLVNAGLNGYYLSFFENYIPNDFSSWKFILGIFLFALGAIVNLKSDQILIGLRKHGEVGYKIPRGFIFEYISCPNHLGEIIQWAGFALMAWNCPAATFFLWTAANLIPRALDHHKWYKKQFENYPAERKAILPGIL
jgi:3-oxo-5-alpha-steroid 4-dehydrogenase 1